MLRTGDTALIRPITPEDRESLRAFHERQSPDSKYRRYFSAKPTLTEAELDRFTDVDFVDRVALVVEQQGEFVAWSSYERWANRNDAEAAFMVDDEHQGTGIATLLLEHMAAIARSNGIERFTAEVLADNRPMMAVFTRAGWPLQRRFDSGVIDLDFDLENTAEFIDSVERREQRADSRAIARLLMPRSIAVIGASDRPGTTGAAVWANLAASFDGPLYPVNPARSTVGDRPCTAAVTEIEGGVDVAVIAVPVSALRSVIDECIAARVRGAVVVTSVDGSDLDMADVVQHARRYGLRIIGPASFGIASPRADTGIQAALVDIDLPPGGVAISMQSGTLASSLLRQAASLELGLSWFVSLGDKCDVSANDLLQFWDDDEATRVIGLYTETLGNPRKFARLARRVSARRPIVAVRTGAALMSPALGALYQQSGVIEVPTVAEMLDTVRVMATQPLMTSPKVALIVNARSPAVLAGAALSSAGLDPVVTALAWSASDDDFGAALDAALADDAIGAVMVVHAPPEVTSLEGPVDHLDRRSAAKPIVAVMLGADDGPIRPGAEVQRFTFPEPAAAVLGRVYAYSAWRFDESAALPEPPVAIDPRRAASLLADALDSGADTVDIDRVADLLATYGVAMPPTRLVPAGQAAAVADDLGYPVAVKALHRRRGRSARAGVALDLASADDVRQAVAVMDEHLGDDAAMVLVQHMVEPGVDLRVHVTLDPRLGPVVTAGLGGVDADAIGDEVSRLAPISAPGARSMLAATRAGTVLDEVADEHGVDVIVRVAQLASDHPEIVEIDLNPVIISEFGAMVTDASVRIAPATAAEHPLRRLE